MGLLIISGLIFIISIFIGILCELEWNFDFLSIISIVTGVISGFVFFIVGIIGLAGAFCEVDNQANKEIERMTIIYDLENIDNDTPIEIIMDTYDEAVTFNALIERNHKKYDNFWTGILYADYSMIEPINIEEYYNGFEDRKEEIDNE